jgi:hypothetical protein
MVNLAPTRQLLGVAMTPSPGRSGLLQRKAADRSEVFVGKPKKSGVGIRFVIARER